MECPECQRQNPDDAKYCNECGCSLIEIKDGKDAIPATESERKHVSILFSDLSGYTAMTEKLDPEEVKEIMNSIFGEITRIIHRYDGFIERFIGDGVMAIFGVPNAHEDDPIRAIRSAMAIHAAVENISPQFEKKIGRPLTMHTGINTGLVVTGNVDIEKGTHGLIGDAINMASRLEDLAKPGEILIGETTYRHAKGVFIFKALEPVTVKGKADHILHFLVMGQKAEPERLSGLAIHGISAPLIGRNTEYDILNHAITKLNEGHGGIVTLIGEAGIGKSRLVADIRKGFMESQDRLLIRWLEGRALSYGQTISYWPFQEILWEFAGITETDNEDDAWIKLEKSLSKLFSDDIGDILPYLASLMSLNVKGEYAEGINYLDGEAVGRLVFLSVRRFFERLATIQPIILVFEDLHWLDESSGVLLEHLLPLVRTVPLLIYITGRPQPNTSATKLPDLVRNEYKEHHKDIQLLPLSKAHSTELIDNLLEIKHIPFQIQEMIVQKAEGNPFFLEEIIRSFIDTGVVDRDKVGNYYWAAKHVEIVTIPDTIQGVIMARVDRLNEDVKHVLKAASVIGRSFFYRVLALIETAQSRLEAQLSELQKIQLIFETQKYPELEYMFKHALAQEAVYDSILLQKRKELHAKVGQAIENLFTERLEEYYGLLAYHYAKAEDWKQAQRYLFKAGDRAGHIAADAEALEHYQNALKAYEHVFGDKWEPVERASLERKIGEALFRRGEHKKASQYLERALGYLTKPLPESRWGIRLAVFKEVLRQIGHRLVPGKYPRKSNEPIRPEVAEEVRIYESIGWVEIFANPERFLLLGLRMLNFCERTGHLLGTVIGYTGLQMVALFVSFPWIARHYSQRAIRLAELIQHPGALGIAYQCQSVRDSYHADIEGQIEHSNHGAASYRKGGYWNIRGWGLSMLIMISGYIKKGNYQDALKNTIELIQFGRDMDDKQITSWGLISKGIIEQCTGKIEESINSFKQTIELAKAVPDYMYVIEALGELGRSLLKNGKMDQALETLEESRRLSVERKMKGHCNAPSLKGLTEAYLYAIEYGEKAERTIWIKRAKKACQDLLKHGKTYQTVMSDAFRLKGTYEWLRQKPSAARKWWKKSLHFSTKKGLLYEKAITHLEMGTRLKDREHIKQGEVIFNRIGAPLNPTNRGEL